MCVAQYAHGHNYSKMSLILLLRKVEAQKTELVATRYLPDVVLIEGSDKKHEKSFVYTIFVAPFTGATTSKL